MNIQKVCFNRVEDFFADCGAQNEVALTQLSAGPLDFRSTQVDLDGVRVQWNRVGARYRTREVYRGPGLMFGWAYRGLSEVKCFGHRMCFDEAVVWPLDEELDFVVPTALDTLIILVDQDLIDLLGWRIHRLLWRQVPTRRLIELKRVCLAATAVALHSRGTATEPGRGSNGFSGAVWRDRILAALEPTLVPWLMPQADSDRRTERDCRNHLIVREVEQLLLEGDANQQISVDGLVEASGIPRRTLFHAFRQSLGVGPLAYLKIVRLHQLCASLLAASTQTSSVVHLAMDLGFTHMGRLSADYRKHFGEYPSDTLRRQ